MCVRTLVYVAGDPEGTVSPHVGFMGSNPRRVSYIKYLILGAVIAEGLVKFLKIFKKEVFFCQTLTTEWCFFLPKKGI